MDVYTSPFELKYQAKEVVGQDYMTPPSAAHPHVTMEGIRPQPSLRPIACIQSATQSYARLVHYHFSFSIALES